MEGREWGVGCGVWGVGSGVWSGVWGEKCEAAEAIDSAVSVVEKVRPIWFGVFVGVFVGVLVHLEVAELDLVGEVNVDFGLGDTEGVVCALHGGEGSDGLGLCLLRDGNVLGLDLFELGPELLDAPQVQLLRQLVVVPLFLLGLVADLRVCLELGVQLRIVNPRKDRSKVRVTRSSRVKPLTERRLLRSRKRSRRTSSRSKRPHSKRHRKCNRSLRFM